MKTIKPPSRKTLGRGAKSAYGGSQAFGGQSQTAFAMPSDTAFKLPKVPNAG